MADTCVFCRIACGEQAAQIVYQDDTVIAFRDVAPVAPVHILLVPRQHLASVDEGEAHPALMGQLIVAAAVVARQEGIAAGGYRLVTNVGRNGGQGVFHLHWHLLGGRRLSWPPG